MKYQFAIDRGGTFTDVWARHPDGRITSLKLLSVDPSNYADSTIEAIKRIFKIDNVNYVQDGVIGSEKIDWIRMGTTVATNALLERKGERCALLITKGFRDLLYIGNQSRPNIFDLKIERPDVLYDAVVEVEERVVLCQDSCQLGELGEQKLAITNEKVAVMIKLNKEKLQFDLEELYHKGFRSIAVVLMHSYMFPEHELCVGEIARQVGFTHVSLSCKVMDMIKIVPRGYTACTDAYLTPCIKKYVDGFYHGFHSSLSKSRALFMQSDGGLTPIDKFCGSRAILSGPAGGVVGYALTSYSNVTKQPVVGFDMGGTSTDVSRYAGTFEHVFESSLAGVSIQAPQLDINTVAAGGGSRLFFRSGLFVVGPESAGAHPGPICYRKSGYLTITDANLVLGRLIPDYFAKIFGPEQNLPLDGEASRLEFERLTQEINDFMKDQGKTMSLQEVAMGFITVANETMCRPIRALTHAKGHDTSTHILACFGGAGGQHACAVARNLGIKKIKIHKYAGILSAFGLSLADVVHEEQQAAHLVYKQGLFGEIRHRFDVLTNLCRDALLLQGFSVDQIEYHRYLNMRYHGTDCALMINCDMTSSSGDDLPYGDFQSAFVIRYQNEFGFTLTGRDILVDDIRIRAVGKSGITVDMQIQEATEDAKPEMITSCFFEHRFLDTKVYNMEKLRYKHVLIGPCIIIDKTSTILIEPDCFASITKSGDVEIEFNNSKKQNIGVELDAVQLSVFSHRFMSSAEQMGRILQRTSISTNIKERLDFSCAVFGPDGGLVANAPHIPVHLGAMQCAVQYQMQVHASQGTKFEKGDVLLSNHPMAGGSHLPDLTVITPVFSGDHEQPVFFVANRGHHADIGGATPGSMPPHSHSIFEEGAVFKSFYLVKHGVFQEAAVTAALMEPAKYKNCTGTRNLSDNLSDLKAQVAANQKGIQLILTLIDEYGLDVVQAYMNHMQNNAEVAVRDMLRLIAFKLPVNVSPTMGHMPGSQLVHLKSQDFMDDGSVINLHVSIDPDSGFACFDFSGTSPQVLGNTNAPLAISQSCLIYCLRCMVGHDVPLNQGCLKPVKLMIPAGCLLSPTAEAAVVGGNVLTSQRLVDVIFRAFNTCAASQGCMNNVTFGGGDEGVSYYETVAGGAGAGPDWHGAHGVHTHMTNTRITDPEILERRYPVILKQFVLRTGSGGVGKFKGGDGVVRELLFRVPQVLSLLTERRAYQPYGLEGGTPGQRGLNYLIRKDGQLINLGGKVSVNILPGESFLLQTPGGGGYGIADLDSIDETTRNHIVVTEHKAALKGSVFQYNVLQETA